MNKIYMYAKKIGIFACLILALIILASPDTFAQKECKASGHVDVDLKLDALNSKCRKAEDAFLSAFVIVIGETATGGKLIELISAASEGSFGPGFQAKYDPGLSFTDAVGFLKYNVSHDSSQETRALNNAFHTVYGRDALPIEKTSWDAKFKAGNAWFAPIVSEETERMNKNSLLRATMIIAAYQKSFGRDDTKTEQDFWISRKEDYEQMLEKNRCYLYSGSATQELFNTAKKAVIINQKNKTPTDVQVNTYIKNVTPLHSLYWEMTAPQSSANNLKQHKLMCGS